MNDTPRTTYTTQQAKILDGDRIIGTVDVKIPHEYSAGSAIEQPGYVVLHAGTEIHYLPPYVAEALAEALRWGARHARSQAEE